MGLLYLDCICGAVFTRDILKISDEYTLLFWYKRLFGNPERTRQTIQRVITNSSSIDERDPYTIKLVEVLCRVFVLERKQRCSCEYIMSSRVCADGKPTVPGVTEDQPHQPKRITLLSSRERDLERLKNKLTTSSVTFREEALTEAYQRVYEYLWKTENFSEQPMFESSLYHILNTLGYTIDTD
jgi:hypothetical protein